MNNIITFLDNYLKSSNKIEITAVEANAALAKAEILKDSHERPGKPLRDLLRKGELPHAYQNGRNWLIPSSTKLVSNKISISKSRQTPISSIQKSHTSARLDIEILAELMNDREFKTANIVDSLIPDAPGIYCIKILNPHSLPEIYQNYLLERNHSILYIGIAKKSLKKRLLHQELRAIGHGTFFRSLGAILDYKPQSGSLIGKANSRNYKFSPEDISKIINWINSNLIINWTEATVVYEQLEEALIKKHLPLFNLSKNPKALVELAKLRSECVKIANSPI